MQLSTLYEALQERSRNILDANKQIKWTVNTMIKIKGEVNDGKYNFNKMIGENPVLKKVPLHEYLSKSGYFSFNEGEFVQPIIDNISSRMLDRNNENILKDMIALIPSKLPYVIECPWLEGENSLNKLCERFNLPIRGMIPASRECR